MNLQELKQNLYLVKEKIGVNTERLDDTNNEIWKEPVASSQLGAGLPEAKQRELGVLQEIEELVKDIQFMLDKQRQSVDVLRTYVFYPTLGAEISVRRRI